jgi:tripartite-type tricarboxylate transporter receptor subunit TctC
MRRNACGSPVMFMDVDASKEKEDGMARVVDHVRGLYVRARVDDARRSKGMEAV